MRSAWWRLWWLLAVAAAGLGGCEAGGPRIQWVRQEPPAVALPEDVRLLAVGTISAQSESDAPYAKAAEELLRQHLARATAAGGRYEVLPAGAGAVAPDATISGTIQVAQDRTLAAAAPTGRLVCTVTANLAISRPSGATLLAQLITEPHDSAEAGGPAPGPGKPTHALLVGLVDKAAARFVAQLFPTRQAVHETLKPAGGSDVAEGNRLAAAGKYAQALERFQRALAAGQDAQAALFNAGVMCEALGRLEQAERFYIRASQVREDPACRAALQRVRNWRRTQPAISP